MYAFTHDEIYSTFAPEVYCSELVRIGNVADGGKWVCNPFNIPQENCFILSLGINNEISFEEEIQEISGKRCSLYAFDMNDQDEDIRERLKKANAIFQIAKISNFTNENFRTYTVHHLLKLYNLSALEILKIDIEGYEFQVIPSLILNGNICQILIEIHGTTSMGIELLGLFSRNGYNLFSYEVNPGFYLLAEFSLIHDSCLEKYDVKPLAKYLSILH
ncbi:unnamed protein product [Dracunculus medinensis]|uniref:Methyltranfer_dom domain-containing protein n=1 Tax=Dracunculus medinensis TaxID=318479 RepID=A0A0N4UJ43_DRAME|nr:unnamed protein product [Dracunculus medinensis]